jgi:hypothetical protein
MVFVTIGLTGLLSACDQLRPFEAMCESRLEPTQIRVVTEPVSYTVNQAHSFAQLTVRGAALVDHGQSILGLTEASLRTQVQVNARGLRTRWTGRYCMRPDVTVQITFNPMTVYVGADEPRESCRYRITWDHEMRHVAVYQRFLPDIAARIERQLSDHFANRVYFFANGDEAQVHVDKLVAEFLSPLVQSGVAEVRDLQRAVDRPQEYARLDSLRARCER